MLGIARALGKYQASRGAHKNLQMLTRVSRASRRNIGIALEFGGGRAERHIVGVTRHDNLRAILQLFQPGGHSLQRTHAFDGNIRQRNKNGVLKSQLNAVPRQGRRCAGNFQSAAVNVGAAAPDSPNCGRLRLGNNGERRGFLRGLRAINLRKSTAWRAGFLRGENAQYVMEDTIITSTTTSDTKRRSLHAVDNPAATPTGCVAARSQARAAPDAPTAAARAAVNRSQGGRLGCDSAFHRRGVGSDSESAARTSAVTSGGGEGDDGNTHSASGC